MPGALYLDKGSEYNWAGFVDDAMKLLGSRLVFGRESNVVNAIPYNARAKEIEGFFGRFERHYLANTPGWIRGDRMKSKTSNVGKAPTPFDGDFSRFSRLIEAQLTIYHSARKRGVSSRACRPFRRWTGQFQAVGRRRKSILSPSSRLFRLKSGARTRAATFNLIARAGLAMACKAFSAITLLFWCQNSATRNIWSSKS